MSQYEDLRSEYLAVYPTYERLATLLNQLLRRRLDGAGLRTVEVTARAKDPDSFVKKALRKGYQDPMNDIGDKAGVRVILPFARDRQRVTEVCAAVLALSGPEDKRDLLGSERIGYAGMHYAGVVHSGVLKSENADLNGLSVELQLHTKAESAWAVAAHDSLYKSVVEVPDDVARRLNRLAALAEIFDDQIEQFQRELDDLPDFALLDHLLPPLDRLLLRFTDRAGDRGLSAMLTPRLATLYDEEGESIVTAKVAPFVEAHADDLDALYQRSIADDRANPLLYQPEGLMLLERLANDPYRLRGIWPPELDLEALQQLATLRGARL